MHQPTIVFNPNSNYVPFQRNSMPGKRTPNPAQYAKYFPKTCENVDCENAEATHYHCKECGKTLRARSGLDADRNHKPTTLTDKLMQHIDHHEEKDRKAKERSERERQAKEWREVADEESGCMYWWNKVTGESSWEKPDCLQPIAHPPPTLFRGWVNRKRKKEEMEQQRQQGRGGSSGTAASTTSAPSTPGLPPGWTSHFDPKYNLSYYYHEASDTTQWEMPTQ